MAHRMGLNHGRQDNVISMKHVMLEPQAKNLRRRPRPFASLKGPKPAMGCEGPSQADGDWGRTP